MFARPDSSLATGSPNGEQDKLSKPDFWKM
jgi:hypothetical protein